MQTMAASQEPLPPLAPVAGRQRKPLAGAHAVSLGLLLTVLQVLVACLLSGRGTFHEAYLSLYQWDSVWYRSIVDGGYNAVPNSHGEANVGFFPGYPCLARQVRDWTGLSSDEAMLLTAQLSCWVFWSYLLLLLSSWGVPWRLTLVSALCVLAYPGAFFLVAAYSESLFLACTLGFFYWSERRGRGAMVLAAVHGFGMTATRLVGLPLAVYPVARVLLGAAPACGASLRDRLRRCTLPLLVSLVTAAGCLSFLWFCHHQFGRWNAYMLTQRAGWGVAPRYLALLSSKVLPHNRAFSRRDGIDPDFVSQLCVPLFLLTFAVLAAVEYRLRGQQGPSGGRQRAGLYLCAWLPFYVSACSMAPRAMGSMVRHSLCVQVLLVLALAHLFHRAQPESAPDWLRRRLPALSVPVFLACELFLLHRFTHGRWVA